MGRERQAAIVAYNGIDGACAAATALLRFPGAQLAIASAASVARSLGGLAEAPDPPSEVHVCGVGVACEWEGLAEACAALREKGAAVRWHCGRGYLDEIAGKLREVCCPVLIDGASNTEAVASNLGLDGHPRAEFLKRLALRDRALNRADPPPTREEEFWCDFVNGSSLQYFKFMDRDAYSSAIRKLAGGGKDEDARRVAEVYRRAGAKHVLAGRSPALAKLKERIRKCAEADEPTLILGESGVGKEWVAHLLHERSRRATGAFVPVNCATFAGSLALANSELFGHVDGAFTGAAGERGGRLASADGGILFLDELGELPLEVQAKLLRVVEDGELVPVGADAPTQRIDARVVAATNRDLPEMVRQGKFREDLFYRLNTLTVRVPPLREHPEDIAEIARTALRQLPPGKPARALAPADLRTLRGYAWPGNVRQLIQVLKRRACLGEPLAQLIEEERRFGCSPRARDADGLLPESPGELRPLAEVQALYARRAVELCGGNKSAAARALGIAVNTLKKHLRQ